MIGSWYCLPEDELSPAAVDEYREAGFSLFQTLDRGADGRWTPYSEAGNWEALDLCQRAGLGCVVVDQRLYRGQRPLPPEAIPTERDVRAAVDAYRDCAALRGYLLYDEPSPHAFPALAQVVGWLRARDRQRFALIPLFPMHDDPRFPNAFEGRSYEQYLRQFVEVVQTEALVYDYYPFFDPAMRVGQYLENFEIASRVARERGLPLWYYPGIVRGPATGLPPTLGRVRFQVSLALAYGARAIFHFTWRGAERLGARDLRTVNDEIQAHLAATDGMRMLGVEHRDEHLTTALFGREQPTHVLAVNRDSERERTLVASHGRWTATVDLPAGGAQLLSLA